MCSPLIYTRGSKTAVGSEMGERIQTQQSINLYTIKNQPKTLTELACLPLQQTSHAVHCILIPCISRHLRQHMQHKFQFFDQPSVRLS